MLEHRVTVVGRTYELEEPFFVLATQNPIEQEGTYPLPEAQLNRFMFLIEVDYAIAVHPFGDGVVVGGSDLQLLSGDDMLTAQTQ